VRDYLGSRSFVLRNQRRTTLMLGLVRLHLNGTDDTRRDANLLSTGLTDRHGVGLPHRGVYDPGTSVLIDRKDRALPSLRRYLVCPYPEPYAHAEIGAVDLQDGPCRKTGRTGREGVASQGLGTQNANGSTRNAGGAEFRELGARNSANTPWWSWRESNPRPRASNQVFSGCSP
jgi:hypothetical protein